ncbi:unnamed protein product [Rotaria magnacalcarata]|uniref:Dolichyldiphosphatase n=1 Tax=Rotaria magnacalcarata TaxID=392030 RepID=A0A816LTS2_9BILA|nr:unnamed protein product [Rotaria magnacalcarata]
MGVLNDPIYRPLSITFIEYREGDKLGFILAWFSMLPFIYIVSLCTLIIFRRDVQTIMYFGGFCVSEVCNYALKRFFKQARPERTRDRMGLYEVHGMPSDHAQTFFYFMTYLAIFVILKSQMPGSPHIRSIRNRVLVFTQLIVAVIVAYSRVYLHYHTVAQVVVGAFFGTALGCGWYYFVNYHFMQYASLITDHPLGKYFLIRDYSLIPRLIHFQYENEYAEAKRWRERRANYAKDQNIMLSGRGAVSNSNDNNTNSNQRRQWSEGIMSTDKSIRLYRDDDRQLIQNLVNEYLLAGSNNVLELIRHCPTECFEALVDLIWHTGSQPVDSNDDDLLIYNQRSSLLSSSLTNVHRKGARRRLAIIFIEVLKLLSTPTASGGRYDHQRQHRIFLFPSYVGQLIHYEPDIYGLSCLALASIVLINPCIIHHKVSLLIDALKFAANHFVKANLSFETPSTFALSIYSLFYLLYLLYPNNLRRELQPESTQSTSGHEKPTNRLGIERVLLPLCYYFKLQPSIVRGNAESEKQDNRWQNESWQQLIANGDRYVVSDDVSPFLSNDLKKRKEEEMRKSTYPTRYDIAQIIRMCNEYTESVLHPSEVKSQMVKNTIEKQYGRKHSTDCYSNCSDSYCQTYEQQWQTTIQNGQMNLSRFQTLDDSNRRLNNNNSTNGASNKKDPCLNNPIQTDHNIHAKVELQLDMLDCNYEHDKREYYAQLIRDFQKTTPINELDKALKAQEIQYSELISIHENKRPIIHELRKRINDFHQMNEAFYNSLSATQVELKTDEDDHWQKDCLFTEKHSKLNNDLRELEQTKVSIEHEIRELQRRSFQSKQAAKESIELRDTIDKLFSDLACARKKHQLLHKALLNVKLKPIDAEKLYVMHQNEEDHENQDLLTLSEKKKKFDEYKQKLTEKQKELTKKRSEFSQLRNMNTHKINIIRRQIDSIRICQTQLNKMNTNSQIISQ